MAEVAFFAELAFVRVRSLVAVEAGPRGFGEFLPRLVAAVAENVLVPSLQFEIGNRVIERFAVEIDDICVPALVVRVAMPALHFVGRLALAVQSGLFAHVRRDVLVADEAEAVLSRPRERLVAVVAVLFRLGVALNEGAGFHQRLDDVLGPAPNGERGRETACEEEDDDGVALDHASAVASSRGER